MKARRVLMAWVTFIAGLAGTSLAQQMPQDNWYIEQTWTNAGPVGGRFSNPAGLALGGTGLVYVADCGNRRVVAFRPDGTYVTQWGSNGGGNGQFRWVAKVAADSNGFVYVTDNVGYSVQVFRGDGIFVQKWTNAGGTGTNQFAPTGIAIGPDGLVYVADQGNGRVVVFQPDGTLVRQWGSSGSLQGQFGSQIRDLAVDAYGQVYVTESTRIQVFQPDGTFVRTWAVSIPFGGLAVDAGGADRKAHV